MSAAATVTPAELRAIDLFDELDDAALQPWADAARVRLVPAGGIVVDAGEEAHGLQLVLAGRMAVFSVDGDRVEPEGVQVAPTWVGAIPSLTGGWHRVRMQAETEVRIAQIEREPFVELVLASRPVFDRLMGTMRPVISRVSQREANRERLAALGTMAAGLAHELNNPAAAAKRAASDLGEALDVFERMVGKIVEAGVDRAEAAKVVDCKNTLLARSRQRAPVSALEASDAEDAITDLLEELGVSEPWRWAEPLAAAGADEAWLRSVAETAGEAIDEVVSWVAASLQAHTLTGELAASTDRMSDLVKAVKSYAFMDRGGLQEIDVHEGLETTITILGHKLKQTTIQIERHYDTSLPRIGVLGSELNQVWTNLLDNAIDALGARGTITLSTRREREAIVVDVADDGPGIPAEIVTRVFDPFFTTKDVGQGTGLGLDMARRIVADRHGGSLAVDSTPEGTTFHVRLPIAQPRP